MREGLRLLNFPLLYKAALSRVTHMLQSMGERWRGTTTQMHTHTHTHSQTQPHTHTHTHTHSLFSQNAALASTWEDRHPAPDQCETQTNNSPKLCSLLCTFIHLGPVTSPAIDVCLPAV